MPVLCRILDVGLGTHQGLGFQSAQSISPGALALPQRSPRHHLRVAALVIPSVFPGCESGSSGTLSGAATAGV